MGIRLDAQPGGKDSTSARFFLCPITGKERVSPVCIEIVEEGEGSSAQQAKLRWTVGLARIQQALLFSSRALKQLIAE